MLYAIFEIGASSSGGEDFQISSNLPFEEGEGPSLKQTLVLITKRCLMPS